MAPSLAGVLPATPQQMASPATTPGGLASQPQETLGVETLEGLFVAEDRELMEFVESLFQELPTWSWHPVSHDCGKP